MAFPSAGTLSSTLCSPDGFWPRVHVRELAVGAGESATTHGEVPTVIMLSADSSSPVIVICYRIQFC